VANLRELLQEAFNKEKEAVANLKQLKEIMAQNAKAATKIRQANSEFSIKEAEQRKMIVERDKTILKMSENLKRVDETFEVMAARNSELVYKNNCLNKLLEEERSKWLEAAEVVAKKRRISGPDEQTGAENGNQGASQCKLTKISFARTTRSSK
jgi:hypothetical protein